MKNNKLITRLGILCIAILGALSWILNMGFNRFVFTIFGIPFIMLAALIAIDLNAEKYYASSKLLIAANIVFNLSYICANVFLPDGMLDSPKSEGNASESYMLFKLIHNSDLYDAFMATALFFFACFVITMIFQIIWMNILKRKTKRMQKELPHNKQNI